MLRSPARVVLQDSSASTSSTLSAPPTPVHHQAASNTSSTVSSRLSLLDTCHRKIRFFGELVAWVPPSSSISSRSLYLSLYIMYVIYTRVRIRVKGCAWTKELGIVRTEEFGCSKHSSFPPSHCFFIIFFIKLLDTASVVYLIVLVYLERLGVSLKRIGCESDKRECEEQPNSLPPV